MANEMSFTIENAHANAYKSQD